MTAAIQTITIGTINTKPELDPYHRDTQGISHTCIRFDPQERTVEVYQDYNDNSTPGNVWHNHIYEWTISEHPSETDMRRWLDNTMPTLERIAAGHSIDWNGSNHVGRLTDDASAAYDRITEEVMQVGLGYMSYYEAWSLDLLENIEHEAIGKTDDEIRQMARDSMAVDASIILLFDEDDAYAHLRWYRDQHTDDDNE